MSRASPTEKLQAEEERRKQEEAEEALRQAEIEAEEARRKAEEEERIRRENSGLKKTGKKFKNFLKSLISEPEDE